MKRAWLPPRSGWNAQRDEPLFTIEDAQNWMDVIGQRHVFGSEDAKCSMRSFYLRQLFERAAKRQRQQRRRIAALELMLIVAALILAAVAM